MSTQQGITCPKCRHVNAAGAKFCNQCASKLEAPAPQPALAPATAPAGRSKTVYERLPHSKSHRSPLFYLAVFAALTVITIIEVGIFYIDARDFRVPALLLLSSAKFMLVIMFFMHLKGDKRFFSLLFVGPLFIGASVLVALVGLFRNF